MTSHDRLTVESMYLNAAIWLAAHLFQQMIAHIAAMCSDFCTKLQVTAAVVKCLQVGIYLWAFRYLEFLFQFCFECEYRQLFPLGRPSIQCTDTTADMH